MIQTTDYNFDSHNACIAMSAEFTFELADRSNLALPAGGAKHADVTEAACDWIWETDAALCVTLLSKRFGERFANHFWISPRSPGAPCPTRGWEVVRKRHVCVWTPVASTGKRRRCGTSGIGRDLNRRSVLVLVSRIVR